ncbi:MAG: AEC family transporter, partial [Clostridiales Family XIII bacterium]|nr:AEC family transporter [Clostridiales Family XIII bacterium]
MVTIFIKVLIVFAFVLIGYVAAKRNWLPADSVKYLSSLVVNIASPALIFATLVKQAQSGVPGTFTFACMGFGAMGLTLGFLVSLVYLKTAKIDRPDQRGVFKNFFIFTNAGFMGYPIAFAIFGENGLLIIVLANMPQLIGMYTLAIAMVKKRDPKESKGAYDSLKRFAKSVWTMPVMSIIVCLAVYFTRIPIPETVLSIAEQVGSILTPVAMMIIGIQLSNSRVKEWLANRKVVGMCILRLMLIPAAMYFILIPFHPTPLMHAVIVFEFMLPCAAVPVALAEQYDGDGKIAAEGTFLSTLLSMATVPVGCLILQSLLGV